MIQSFYEKRMERTLRGGSFKLISQRSRAFRF